MWPYAALLLLVSLAAVFGCYAVKAAIGLHPRTVLLLLGVDAIVVVFTWVHLGPHGDWWE